MTVRATNSKSSIAGGGRRPRAFLFPLLCALLLVVPAKQSSSGHAPAATTPPALSAADSSEALKILAQDIERILSTKWLKRSSLGLNIFSLDSDKSWYTKNNRKAFTPASTTKMYSTFAAYYLLGEDFNVATTIYTDAPQVEKGILDGNLYLVGYGDPLLSTEDIEQLADQVSNLGIDSITGTIYADGSYFDSLTNRLTYSGDADIVQKLPPVSGLTVNRNSITVMVRSLSTSGTKLRVQTIPDCSAIDFTVNARSRRGRYYSRSVKFRQQMKPNGKQHFTVNGYLAPGRSYSYKFHIKNPTLVAADLLRSRLIAGGIGVAGGFGEKSPDMYAAVLTETFHSLNEIIAETNKRSDNFLAENIFKLIGAHSGVGENTARESVTMIRTSMEECAIDFEGCRINDGSGLSRRNLFTPHSQVQLLTDAMMQPFGEVYYQSLSVAGEDGTLAKRMRGTPAEGNLVGKTGTLRNVSALAGYVQTRDGERLAFSFLFNGKYVSHYKKIENQLGSLLAGFSYSKALTRG